MTLEIISLESSGISLPSDQWNQYLEVSPISSVYTGQGASFVINSHDALLKTTLRATLTTPLTDGSTYTTVSSPIALRVSDESIDVTPLVDGTATGTIDTTLTLPVDLSFIPRSASGDILPSAVPYTLDIYNSFDDTAIETGIIIPTPKYTLSFTYSKKIGSYRFVVRDALGRSGESTLTVRS